MQTRVETRNLSRSVRRASKAPPAVIARSSLGALLGACLSAGSGACSSAAMPPTASAPTAKIDTTMSDPAEYRVSHISEDAGEAIFSRIGVGDPYRTGLPYPIFLAFQQMYPDVLGANVAELADRFGFTPRAADAQSADADTRDGLPIAIHLTDDPNTHVPFLVHSCAMCHSEIVKWPGGEKLVIGLGNPKIKIHAYDDALAKIAGRPDFDREHVGAVARRIAQERDTETRPSTSKRWASRPAIPPRRWARATTSKTGPKTGSTSAATPSWPTWATSLRARSSSTSRRCSPFSLERREIGRRGAENAEPRLGFGPRCVRVRDVYAPLISAPSAPPRLFSLSLERSEGTTKTDWVSSTKRLMVS